MAQDHAILPACLAAGKDTLVRIVVVPRSHPYLAAGSACDVDEDRSRLLASSGVVAAGMSDIRPRRTFTQ